MMILRIPIIRIKSWYNALNNVLFWLLTFFTLLTPADSLGLKKITLAVLLILNVQEIIRGIGKNKFYFFFFVFLPLLTFVISVSAGGGIIDSVTALYTFLYLWLIFPAMDQEVDLKKMLLVVGNIMTAIIFISGILDALHILSVGTNPLLQWLATNGEAQISVSSYAMFHYVLFLNASPILLFNLIFYLNEKRYVLSIIVFISVLWTGTRANIFTAAVVVIMYVILYEENKIIKVFSLTLIIGVFVAKSYDIKEKIELINWAKNSGDQIRNESISSILYALCANKIRWLIGMGFGTTYYSTGRIKMVTTSEMSYFEYVRTCGVPISIFTFYLFIKPLLSMWRKKDWIFAFYIAYLVQGIFEPFIFTSTGFFVLMAMYVFIDNFQMSESQIT